MKRLSAVFSMLLFVGAVCSAQDKPVSAHQIMDQVIATYASCDSYLDEGEVRTLFLDPRGNHTEVKPFSTAFVRPWDFRFEFKHRKDEHGDWQRYIVWSDAQSIRNWWSIDPGVKSFESLTMAIAGATGVSSGSALAIPSLLLPEFMVKRYGSLIDLELAGEEKVDGDDAYRIEAKDGTGRALTLWVDKDSLLIVKTFERKKFESFEAETTTTYKPRANVKVAMEKLAFDAPEKGD